MFRKTTHAVSFFLVLGVFLFSFSSSQANHGNGHEAHVRGEVSTFRSVICDTKEQMLSIAETHKASGHMAGVQRFRVLNSTPGRDGNPQCGFTVFQGVVLEQVATYKDLDFITAPGVTTRLTFYVYKISSGGLEYYTWGQWPLEEPGRAA